MADNKNQDIQRENVEHENELIFNNKVIEKIANYAVKDVDGILELKGDFTSGIRDFFSSGEDETKGVSAEVGKKEVALDLEVIAEYGKNIPQAFDKAVDLLSERIEEMTNLKVVEVNMHVNDIMTRKDYEAQKNEDERRRAEQERQERQNVYQQNTQGQYSDGSRVQ